MKKDFLDLIVSDSPAIISIFLSTDPAARSPKRRTCGTWLIPNMKKLPICSRRKKSNKKSASLQRPKTKWITGATSID